MTSSKKVLKMTTAAFSARSAVLSLVLLAAACGGGEGGDGVDSTVTGDSVTSAVPMALGANDVATASMQQIRSGMMLTGSLQPVEQIPIVAQIEGTVSRITVDRGSNVNDGTVMAELRAEGIRAGAQASVASAQAGLALATQQRDAARLLSAEGAMSRIDLQAAESGYEAAVAQLAAAKAMEASAAEDNQRTVIRSPITGAVSERAIEIGQQVRIGDPMFTVVNSSSLELEGQIPVSDAGSVKVGQVVEFSIAGSNVIRQGKVQRVAPVADPSTRQVSVFARLANAGGDIVAGQFVRGTIITGDATESLVVPRSAIRGSADSAWVLVIENGIVARRQVTTGTADAAAGVIEITEGLQVGDHVVTLPGSTLVPGSRVSIDSPRTAAADTAAQE